MRLAFDGDFVRVYPFFPVSGRISGNSLLVSTKNCRKLWHVCSLGNVGKPLHSPANILPTITSFGCALFMTSGKAASKAAFSLETCKNARGGFCSEESFFLLSFAQRKRYLLFFLNIHTHSFTFFKYYSYYH